MKLRLTNYDTSEYKQFEDMLKDRKSVAQGKSVMARVELGGRRIIRKKI